MRIKVVFLFLVLSFCPSVRAQSIAVSAEDAQKIADRVFKNECADQDTCLMQWNDGEDFLSLGIGHFIWYPKGKKGPFKEVFPDFLNYIKLKGQQLPEWLSADPAPACPWNSKENFLKDRLSPKANDLQQLLLSTKAVQGEFLIRQLNEAFPLILKNAPRHRRQQVRENFYLVSSTPSGIYALVDYVNFKGLGVLTTERYQDKGWGLLQVLLDMKMQDNGRGALEEFAKSADKVLAERVRNSPPERNEQRWLPGWQNRIKTYLEYMDNH